MAKIQAKFRVARPGPCGIVSAMSKEKKTEEPAAHRADFIREIVAADLESGKHQAVVTRFPPEPNGYLHIGHAKAICLNFGIAEENAESGARCHLRFDDTNPAKEESEYVDSIMDDIRWLGFDWGEHVYYASDYFEQLYEWAQHLIKEGKAYVDDSSAEEIRAGRGTLTEPGVDSKFRDRSPEENLDLFKRMREGEFAKGDKVLRAKVDMASPNMNLRDPVMYRILQQEHHRTGDAWCIYPNYDFAHGQSDAIEGITHSLCTLEFEHHRPLYDWFVENLPVPAQPRQIEFARFGLTYTMMSKRLLLELVRDGHVDGWDDPRMSTISGYRRKGYTAAAIRNLCKTVGVTKTNSMTDVALLEHALREDLNKTSLRRMAVLDPIKVVIENWPEGTVEEMMAINNPEDPDAGKRPVSLAGTVYIERADFEEVPPPKYYRLSPGSEVRLRYSYTIICKQVIKDSEGVVTELRCSYDPETLGKNPEGRKVRAAIHWVDAASAVEAEVRLYDHLFTVEDPGGKDSVEDWTTLINPDSLKVLKTCYLEPSLAEGQPGERFQFERNGYFCVDTKDSKPESLVFNRTVALRDSWAKKKKG
ncbi:MAG: glutaminyl-tRNA synthetase [Verrucomicrobiales bacterium]|jgi:glutaminyl-tRNA synthetase